jgi:hypothetical protein
MDIPKIPQKIGLQDSDLRNLLSRLIRQSGKKRCQISDEMGRISGLHISERMLNDWTSECHRSARFPAFLVEPFCQAIGNDELQRRLVSERLRELIGLGEKAERLLKRSKR